MYRYFVALLFILFLIPRAAHADTALDMASYCEPYRHATITGRNPDGTENLDVPGANVQSSYCWAQAAGASGAPERYHCGTASCRRTS